MTDLNNLERKAREATPGPWHAGSDWVTADLSFESTLLQLNSTNSAADVFDLSFIAAANPSTILDLIARCREAEEEVVQVTHARDVLHDSYINHLREVEELRQKLAKAEPRVAELGDYIAQRKWEQENIGALPAWQPVANVAESGRLLINTAGGPDEYRARKDYRGPLYSADAILAARKPLEEQLAAAQAREQRYREALSVLAESVGRFVSDEGWQQLDMDNMDAADCLLALPQDTSALQAMITKAGEVMRERCAVECETHYNFSNALAAAIRVLPGVTLEDLQK